jgi:hypothetical protein
VICGKSRARPPGKFSLVLLLQEARSAVLFLAFTSYTCQGTDFREFVSLVCVSGPHWSCSSTEEQPFSQLAPHEQGEVAVHGRAVRTCAQVLRSPLIVTIDFYRKCTRTLSLRESRWTSMPRERRPLLRQESMTTVAHTYKISEKSHGYLTVSTRILYIVLGHWNLNGEREEHHHRWRERGATRHGRILKSDLYASFPYASFLKGSKKYT